MLVARASSREFILRAHVRESLGAEMYAKTGVTRKTTSPRRKKNHLAIVGALERA